MKRLDVSGAVRPIYGSLGVKRLMIYYSNKVATVAAYVIFQLVGNYVKFHTSTSVMLTATRM